MLKRIFTKRRTEHFRFHTGTDGMEAHEKFIQTVDENGYKIVNAWVIYHDYSSSHRPAYLHYVVQTK